MKAVYLSKSDRVANDAWILSLYSCWPIISLLRFTFHSRLTGNVLVVLTGSPPPKPHHKMTGLNKTVKEPENTDDITSAVGCSQSPHCFEGRSDHSLHTAEKSNKTCHYYTLSLDLIMARDLCHVLWHQSFCYSPHKSVEGPEVSTLLQPLWINPKRR